MSGFTFLDPWRLLLLVGVVILAVAYVVLQRRGNAYAVRFTNLDLLASVAPKRPGWRRHVAAATYLLALTLVVVGFARPAVDTKKPRQRATVMLAIDTSLSMNATDVAPSRIDAAKSAAQSFLKDVPSTINVGLVSFNGVASLKVAPTTDRQQVSAAIDSLQLGESTAIGEAIYASLGALQSVPPAPDGSAVPAAIVLMSDGATTEGRSNASAAAEAAKEHVPVTTIAFGTDHGTVMVPGDSTPVPVPVDKQALAAIASTTGGSSYQAASENELKSVYQTIGSSVGYDTVQSEITMWFVGAAMVVMVLAGGLSLIWFSRLP